MTLDSLVDLRTAAILALSLLFVWRLKNREPVLVVLAGIAGILMKGV